MICRALMTMAALWAPAVFAQDLSFPSNAEQTGQETEALASYPLPDGPWADGTLPVQLVEGSVQRQAWRIAATDLSTLQILRPLRAQLREDGYRVTFSCAAAACGGFDFRFAIPVMLPPKMEVNLRDYHFLAAQKDGAAVSLLASRTAQAGYVQVTTITPIGESAPASSRNAPALRSSSTAPAARDDLATALETKGRFILHGLEFAPGSAQLSDEDVPALADLADYLAANSDRTVALVGHTDASGALDANIALSKRRAGTVMERLISTYQVPRRQIAAEGMGYLSPVASNLDPAGRALNRRVEVIVTSTDQ